MKVKDGTKSRSEVLQKTSRSIHRTSHFQASANQWGTAVPKRYYYCSRFLITRCILFSASPVHDFLYEGSHYKRSCVAFSPLAKSSTIFSSSATKSIPLNTRLSTIFVHNGEEGELSIEGAERYERLGGKRYGNQGQNLWHNHRSLQASRRCNNRHVSTHQERHKAWNCC